MIIAFLRTMGLLKGLSVAMGGYICSHVSGKGKKILNCKFFNVLFVIPRDALTVAEGLEVKGTGEMGGKLLFPNALLNLIPTSLFWQGSSKCH